MFWLSMALAGATAASAGDLEPHCREQPGLINRVLHEEPRPLGMTVSFASDYGLGKLLHFRTTHFLGYSALPFQEGSASVTYYAHLGGRVCEVKLDATRCPELEDAENVLRSRTYPVLSARTLIPNSSTHNPSILLHAQDGEGNTMRIKANRPDHPLATDVAAALSAIARCTRDADRRAFESD